MQESDDPCPSPGLPTVVPLTGAQPAGRPGLAAAATSTPRSTAATTPASAAGTAQLTTDGQRWWVEDLQSSNGTYVGAAAGPLPEDPITPASARNSNPDDRIYVGAWTRLVVRKATPEEQAGQA